MDVTRPEQVDEAVRRLTEIGYVVDARGPRELTMLALERPRWAVVTAVFLFPIGLPLLLIKRPRELRLRWPAGRLELVGPDRAARAVVWPDSRRGKLDSLAPQFAAGAIAAFAAWVVSVQLVGRALVFVTAIVAATLVGAGCGTLIATRALPDRSPVRWGALPALAGALAMALAMSALVALLVLFGA